MDIELIAVGYSTMEAVPLFHVAPGGSILRLLVGGGRDTGVDCDWVDTCSILTASISSGVRVDAGSIVKYASKWGVDAILFDGVDPLGRVERRLIEVLRSRFLIGSRVQDPGGLDPSLVDFLLVDHIEPIGGDVPTHVLVGSLNGLMGKTHIEVLTYLEEPRYEEIIPIVEAVRGCPIHVFIHNYERGLHVFMKELARRAPYSYIHAGPHSRLDTYCPRCGTPLLSRGMGRLGASNLKNGSCPRCGYRIPLIGRVYDSTPSRIYMVTRGATEWLHPARLG